MTLLTAEVPTLMLSIFPGIGLLDRAFEAEGFCVVRGPDLLWGGDIRRFHPPAGVFDGVIGGPPCQQFSPLVHLLRAQGREPKHPNLIPEFERIVAAAAPMWFVMENVPLAPLPAIVGYGITAFQLCPTHLDAGDGFGHEQRRVRRFSFGVRGRAAPDLRRWIDYAALELAETAATVVTAGVDNSPTAKGRVKMLAVTSSPDPSPCAARWLGEGEAIDGHRARAFRRAGTTHQADDTRGARSRGARLRLRTAPESRRDVPTPRRARGSARRGAVHDGRQAGGDR